MRTVLERYGFVREGEGGGQGGGQGDGGGQGGGGFAYPQGYPDALKGATLEESFGKLFGGYGELNTRTEGLRTQLARLPKAPEKPENYSFQPSEKLKPFFGGEKENPAMPFARAAMHKHGVSQEAFQGIIEDMYVPMIDAGLLPAPYNPQAEIERLGKELNLDRAGLSTALGEADRFAKGLAGQLRGVPEAMKNEVAAALDSLTHTAAGMVLLRGLSSRLAENGIRIAGEAVTNAGEMSLDEAKKLNADPRINPANREHTDPAKRFDPELRKRFDAAYAKHSKPQNASW